MNKALAILLLATLPAAAAEPMRALLVGGGPDPDSNAAQIESHVRFVAGLLPAGAKRRLLFADGKTDGDTVAAADPGPLANARAALSVLLPNSGLGAGAVMRPPALGVRPDGPSTHQAFRRAFADLQSKSSAPYLLYFAGHGSRDGDSGQVAYSMWNNEDLSPRELAAQLAHLPDRAVVTLVMAQCYSGAFADLIYRNADPKGDPAPQTIAGFFSARRDRTASGCGTGTAAEDYQDFSSYFFGALSGHDRFGKPVRDADVDGDGRVTLHEAFCYALGHDASFDTPVCTSGAFLERFAGASEEEIFSMPYPEALQAATPAQRVALDLLSSKLGAHGDDRALAVYDRLTFAEPIGRPAQLAADRQATDQLSRVRSEELAALLKKWPGLRWNQSAGFTRAVADAAKELGGGASAVRDILAASQAHEDAEAALDNEEAWLIRFADLYRSIGRTKHLREHGDKQVKARFERLWAAENAEWKG